MRSNRLKSLRTFALLTVAALLGLIAFGPAEGAQAATFPPITGSGSTYAAPALDQWATDLSASQRLSINFYPVGSAQGRQQYAEGLRDFAGTDISYLQNGTQDPFAGTDPATNFAYSYIPDVAGGLSFLYNLQVKGHKITNMRLSGKTLAEIFTGHITNWDDKAITHDYGQQLPSIPITVVTRSDGAGESYFLTNWMDKEYRSLWVPFCVAHGGPPGCGVGPTEQFPGQGAGFRSLNGSDTLSSYIASSSNNGAIGYAEQYYGQAYHIPTVNMLNAAGYYVPPSAANVAIALESAKINPDQNSVLFLMQDLTKVYTDKDRRAYPLSSYSYLVVPRNSRTFNGQNLKPLPYSSPAGGKTLSTYVNYILCGAQQKAANLGYSPLPQEMVQGGFLQYSHIPGAVPSQAAHNYNSCNNPAYHDGVNLLTKNAPFPKSCQKVGEPASACVVVGQVVPPGGGGSGGGTGSGSGKGSGNGSGSGSGKNGAGGPGSGASGSNATINPNTGQVEGGPNGTVDTNLADNSTSGIAGSPAEQWTFGILAAVLLVLAVAMPAGLGAWLAEAGGRRPRNWSAPRQPFPSVRPPANGLRPPANGPQPPDPGSSPSSAGPSNVNVNPPSQDGGSLT
jgi:phosphate transport system substrate-binding protein